MWKKEEGMILGGMEYVVAVYGFIVLALSGLSAYLFWQYSKKKSALQTLEQEGVLRRSGASPAE